MIGSIRWNIVFAGIGTFLTVVFSSSVNGLGVTMLRGLYAAIAFFILAYLLRFVLGLIVGPLPEAEEEAGEESRGAVLDMATPDDADDLNRLLRSQLHESTPGTDMPELEQEPEPFRPLSPPKLASRQQDPEQLAEALRKLKDQEEQN